ncbi:MAG: hypothetical protein K9M02_09510 [Thiohalocapsa sp.]|nr:hypothetical protein [Thiohalocapsa sp.]
MRSATTFLAALAAVVLVLASIAALQTRFAEERTLDVAGDWTLSHQVRRGPFKGWTFDYRLHIEEDGGRLRGTGKTVAVNGRAPRDGERTTLQVIDGMQRRGSIIAWVFERNGERAGRGALRWRADSDDLLIGTFVTTFYRGVSVAQRIEAGNAPEQ